MGSDETRAAIRGHLLRGEIPEGEALARDLRDEALARGDHAVASEAARRLGEFAWERLSTPDATDFIEEAYELRQRAGEGGLARRYLESCLANLYWEAGRASEAIEMERRAREGLDLEGWVPPPDERLALSELLRSLSSFESRRERHAEAAKASGRGLELLERAPGAETIEVASACVGYGMCLQRVDDDSSESLALYERSLAIRLEHLGPEHVYTGFTLDHLGSLLLARGDHVRARECLARGKAIIEARLGLEHPSLSTPLVGLAALDLIGGDGAAARVWVERAISIEERALGPTNPRLASTLHTLALIHLAGGRLDESLRVWERIVAMLVPIHACHRKTLADAIHQTLVLYDRLDRHEDALGFASDLLDRWDRDPEVAPELLAQVLNGASRAHAEAKRYHKAEKLLRRAIGLAERRYGSHGLELDPLLANLVELLTATSRRKEADEVQRRRRNIRTRSN